MIRPERPTTAAHIQAMLMEALIDQGDNSNWEADEPLPRGTFVTHRPVTRRGLPAVKIVVGDSRMIDTQTFFITIEEAKDEKA